MILPESVERRCHIPWEIVDFFVVLMTTNGGIKKYQNQDKYNRGGFSMKIKAGNWTMLTVNEKLFILKAVSLSSKLKIQGK
jgi:hypothetical protein